LDRSERVRSKVADRGELGVAQLAQVPHKVRPPVAVADNGEAQRLVAEDRWTRTRSRSVHRVARRLSSSIGVRRSSLRSRPKDQLRAYATSMSSASPN